MGLQNVVVSGGAGYIGSHVVLTLLLARRFKVISIDNHHNSHPKALGRVSKLARDALPKDPSDQDKQSAEVDAYSTSLNDAISLRDLFARYGKGNIWGVIHIAAHKAVGESSEIPLTYYANNCHRLVYSSSATVYGIPPIIPIPETTPLKAESVYGRTKVFCETIIDDLCRARPEWRAISLRYFNPAGAHESGMIGEDPVGRPGNLLPLLAQMAVGRVRDPVLKIFGNDYPTRDGTCVRDYIHILDLAAGHVLALDALSDENVCKTFGNVPEPHVHFKAYNLGKGRGQSVLEIVHAMTAVSGHEFKTEVIGRRTGDVPDLTADPTLAEKELGFSAPRELETMCRDLWNWQTKNPLGYDTPETDPTCVDGDVTVCVGGKLSIGAEEPPSEQPIDEATSPVHPEFDAGVGVPLPSSP
ncbi:hypothetical protein BS47DRAFT_1347190 [Hydnum rufescens UP504]|uniref:NAD(P)-binding domain-containing protein n=1 Tax=Hydnum rufescens UP504 TaxID=1448309 RepID=A0A9P6ASC4_9AGAM|nr:hypothetical protein BS47DRAFT_1347190 [Hydnum rufescens UP504]